MEPQPPALGRLLLIDLYDCACDEASLNDPEFLRNALIEAAREGGATIVNDCFHRFSPVGASGVVVIAESHLAIHTWPEHKYVAIDLFTCSGTIDPQIMQKVLERHFQPERSEVGEVPRGRLNSDAPPFAIESGTSRSKNPQTDPAN